MFLRIQLSFIHKHAPWAVCFQTAMWKKPAWFYEPQFGRISRNISILDSVLKLKKFKHKCWIWTAELFQFVKYCRTLTVWHFRQLWIEPFYQGFWLAYFSMFYESLKHTDETLFALKIELQKEFDSRRREENSTRSRVFPYTSFVVTRFLSTLYQNLLNTAEASLFV